MTRPRQLAIAALLGSAVATAPVAEAAAQGGAARDSSEMGRTHVVRKGDTLWELARRYLGDGHKWELLYRLNLGVVLNPHWIEPGQVLKVGGTGPKTLAARTAPKSTTKSAENVAAPATITDVRIGAGGQPSESVIPPAVATAEAGAPKPVKDRGAAAPRATAVRSGDHLTAPYATALGGPTGTGRIESTLGTSVLASTPRLRMVQYRDRVRVALPTGATGAVGEQLLLIRLGDVLGNDAQVVIPVGVLTLTAAVAGGVAEAELTKKFDEVMVGQPVTVLDPLSIPAGVRPVATTFGPATRVRWIAGNSVLSAPGQHVILTAGTADGLVPGDQLSLRDVANEELEVAVAQVTRVTDQGSSAIVLQVRQGGVVVGMRARVSAKMP
jgi:LysM repeat protein